MPLLIPAALGVVVALAALFAWSWGRFVAHGRGWTALAGVTIALDVAAVWLLVASGTEGSWPGAEPLGWTLLGAAAFVLVLGAAALVLTSRVGRDEPPAGR